MSYENGFELRISIPNKIFSVRLGPLRSGLTF